MMRQKFIPLSLSHTLAKSARIRYPQGRMQERDESIWQVGNTPGKTLTVVGGTHGNERTGVEVVFTLKAMIERGALFIKQGTLNVVLGNPRAIDIHERGSQPFHDLNRSYPVDLLSREPDGTYENARARLIAPFLASSDVVIDIHATNKPSEPFLSCLHCAHHEEVYRWFPCAKVLADPNFVMGGVSVTTDEYTEAHGGIGICYETGQAADTSRVEVVVAELLNLMGDLGLIEHSATVPACSREIYELIEPIILTQEGFCFAGGRGEQSWEPFVLGDTIGYHAGLPLVAAYDGMLVFPKLPTHWQVGKAVGYLARRGQI
jgi:predicted deacylase